MNLIYEMHITLYNIIKIYHLSFRATNTVCMRTNVSCDVIRLLVHTDLYAEL